ncbi:MAG: ornithine cyclodeaminase family protein [Gammaproteobacteria bacterium]|nr:ornithine cyclodeaminase family protein [Gammaproteobacteria bacterium]
MKHLDAKAIAARLDRRSLVDALDAAFRGAATAPMRQHHAIGEGAGEEAALLLMPAWSASSIGVKLVTVFPGNAVHGLPAVHAAYALFDARTGEPRATLDGTELTRRRTAAASALASRYLSRTDCSRLLMIGTGGLAPHLIESHSVVRPIREVRIWGRQPERAAAVAAGFAERGFSIETVTDLRAAVEWADLVSCATLSSEPLVRGEWLRSGQHLDLVGAYTPRMCEADTEALLRARVYVDTRAGALAESGELVQAIATGRFRAEEICGELADLASGRAAGRGGAAEITLFKSVGTALEDLAAAELALARG